MLVELITGLVALIPPAVRYVGGALGREVLDRRAKRLENEYGGLFQEQDAKLIGDIASTSALLARFDAVASTIETPKRTKSSAVSGTLAAAVFYGAITFILTDADIPPSIMLFIAFVFIALALGGSTVWDRFFTTLTNPDSYAVQVPHKSEAEAPPIIRDTISYRHARSKLQKKVLSQMSGLMDVLSKSEVLGKYADNITSSAPEGATDAHGKYASQVAVLVKETRELAGAEPALRFIVSQRPNPRFKYKRLNLAHEDRIYSFSLGGDGRIPKPEKTDMVDFKPRNLGEKVPVWKYRTHASVERWRKDNIHVDSSVESTFWLPPEVQVTETEVKKKSGGVGKLDNSR